MTNSLLYQIALTLIPNIGPVQAKLLLQHYDVEEIFKARKESLGKIEGLGEFRVRNIKSFDNFGAAEEEIAFIQKNKITPLFITDKDYPQRLLNCFDSPTLLFYKGEANLNTSKIISVIGSRSHTDYGRQVTEKLIQDLWGNNILVISGLALGIDGIAHTASLKNNLPTVGVMGHGLDMIYPHQHAGLADEMTKYGGGILTEFRSKTIPDRHNFPLRNRIVAGMSDATIVVETAARGGSLITAELANGYNKDVFAFPGKVTDTKSAGCNYLIKSNKAILLTGATELIELMGWEEKNKKQSTRIQRELFIELTVAEKSLMGILKEKEFVHIDELNLKSGLNSSAVAAAILNLEIAKCNRVDAGEVVQAVIVMSNQ